jgi:hypothetical protein
MQPSAEHLGWRKLVLNSPCCCCCCVCVLQVSRGDVEILVDTFPGQSIDFFGALRARVYDDKVRSAFVRTWAEFACI